MMMNPSNLRKLTRPIMAVGAITLLSIGYLVSTPSGDVVVPFADAAVVDAPVDAEIDAVVDAAIDAPPGVLDPLVKWPRHEIYAHADCDGADGVSRLDVDGDGDLDLTGACEQGGQIWFGRKVSCSAPQYQVTALPGSSIIGPEDASFGDVDGDGLADIIDAESGGKIRWWENTGTASNPLYVTDPLVVVSSSIRYIHSRVVEPGVIVGCAYSTSADIARFELVDDVWGKTSFVGAGFSKECLVRDGDGDGEVDDIMTFDATGAHRGVGYITNVTGTATVQTRIDTQVNTLRGTEKNGLVIIGTGASGVSTLKTMTMLTVADKTFVVDNATNIATVAAHGLETGDGPIKVANSGGALPGGLSASTEYFVIKLDANTFKFATSRANAVASTSVDLTSDGTGTQTLSDVPAATARIGTAITFPSNFGWFQAAELGDLDGDGIDDLVITGSHAGDSDACASEACDSTSSPSSVLWIKGGPGNTFSGRGEISGSQGVKHDNPALVDVDCDGDLDVITTEEKYLGVVWYENQRCSPAQPCLGG